MFWFYIHFLHKKYFQMEYKDNLETHLRYYTKYYK